jgi:hypothetical protein
MDRKTRAREKLRAKLARKQGKEYKILTDEEYRKKIEGEQCLKLVDRLVKKDEFKKFNYSCFKEEHFIQFLRIMAKEGNGFSVIDQKTINSLNEFLWQYKCYEDFFAEQHHNWETHGGSLPAFKYLFQCAKEQNPRRHLKQLLRMKGVA